MQLEDSYSENIEVDTFTDGNLLQKSMDNGEIYNLVFLDIMMPSVNGIEIGQFIRKSKKNHHTQIAYISSESKYAMELFQVQQEKSLLIPFVEIKNFMGS